MTDRTSTDQALTTSIADARLRIAAAIQTLAEATETQDIITAIQTLEGADAQIEAAEQAMVVVNEANKTLYTVALKLREQRDQAIKARDEAQEINDEISNEAVDERLQWDLPAIISIVLEAQEWAQREEEAFLIRRLEALGAPEKAAEFKQLFEAVHTAQKKADTATDEAQELIWILLCEQGVDPNGDTEEFEEDLEEDDFENDGGA